ncbi:MAG: hypothetical protein WCT25_01540 [Candidatus Paceibacterota bacterium]|jgi:hypothetical protein
MNIINIIPVFFDGQGTATSYKFKPRIVRMSRVGKRLHFLLRPAKGRKKPHLKTPLKTA